MVHNQSILFQADSTGIVKGSPVYFANQLKDELYPDLDVLRNLRASLGSQPTAWFNAFREKQGILFDISLWK